MRNRALLLCSSVSRESSWGWKPKSGDGQCKSLDHHFWSSLMFNGSSWILLHTTEPNPKWQNPCVRFNSTGFIKSMWFHSSSLPCSINSLVIHSLAPQAGPALTSMFLSQTYIADFPTISLSSNALWLNNNWLPCGIFSYPLLFPDNTICLL